MIEDTGFFNFKKTGVAEIDNILKEVDNAGEKCRTKDWADDTEGLSFIDLIQDAANKAVEIYKTQRRRKTLFSAFCRTPLTILLSCFSCFDCRFVVRMLSYFW